MRKRDRYEWRLHGDELWRRKKKAVPLPSTNEDSQVNIPVKKEDPFDWRVHGDESWRRKKKAVQLPSTNEASQVEELFRRKKCPPGFWCEW